MKYRIVTTKRFDKAVLRCISRGYDIVWEQHDDTLLLIMVSTGTHSDLFNKKRR